MTPAIAPPRIPAGSATPAPPRPARRPGALPWLLVAGTVAQVLVRLWFARARTGPAADPDETGYLVAARWLAGGPGGDLTGHTFYQGGYPLLLSPAYWFTHDPATVYTLVMGINAVLGALLFPLGYAAARRFGFGRRAAPPIAFAAALLPATTFFGAFALADAVLPALVLAWLLALDRFARHGRASDAVAASLAASYMATVHTRGTVLLAVHVGALIAVAVTRRSVRAAAVGGCAAAAGLAAGTALNAHVRAALYPRGARDLAELLETRLASVPGQEWALSGAAGQVWYLIVSTWGLAGAGLVAVAAVLVRRRAAAADRTMAAVVLAATFGIAYASSAALPDEHRVGNFAYGRYLSCVALVYALAGAAALARSHGRTALRLTAAAVIAVELAGLCVTAYAGERLRTHKFIGFDFPEVMFLTGDRAALHLQEATLVACALLCGFLALSRLGGRRAVPAMAAALAVVGLAALTSAMGPSPRRQSPPPPFPGPAAGGVAADVSLNWVAKVKLQVPVWWTRVDRVDIRAGRPPAEGVCTVVVALPDGTPPEASWPGHPDGWRPHTGRTGPDGWVSWHAPSCPAARGQ
ncbi:hypothetical protein ACFOY4_16280 [Actinomadura syzygii]|uniref:Glycosyltransferase RgtA/B/C/D-like domain-containing protein n=1 Tax=Actinomadura syzygii TaxID=1427538 RepID=A0A5D0U137_9ACTN|nr:hypothetical protein [Actinomadura syzygii]TYC11493.1 hypothetical protein FXF65_25605 [Actinomadura syzygii]